MRLYLISLVAGIGVGLFYGLLGMRSPAPPVIALLGLLGMLGGEQIVPIVKSYVIRSEAQKRNDDPIKAVAHVSADGGRNDIRGE